MASPMRIYSSKILGVFLYFTVSFCFAQNEIYKKADLLSNKSEIQKIIESNNDSVRLEAIEYLLTVKGDTRINITWYGFTNDAEREKYNLGKSTNVPEFKYATNQFVALYLISAIYFSNTEYCSLIQIVFKNKNGQLSKTTNLRGKYVKKFKLINDKMLNIKFKVVDQKIVKSLYEHYNSWFLDLKKNGFTKTKPIEIEGLEWRVFKKVTEQ